MNVQLPVHLDKPAFLAWAEGRKGRYEFVGGRVVMTLATRWSSILLCRRLPPIAEGSAKCWAWVRRETGFPPAQNLIVGLDKIIRLKMPRLSFPSPPSIWAPP